jgi:hypothetical protein
VKRLAAHFGSVILLMVCGSATIAAQSGAILRGQVVDELNAVIPGAQLTLTTGDGKQFNISTDANGEFTLLQFAPGIYTLSVEAEGFQPYSERELRLPLNRPLLKLTLKVAAVSIETEVKAEEPGVSVEPDQNLDATVLGEDFVDTLPDNEEDLREYLLALASPGAGGAAGGQGGAQIYINGFRGGRLPPREAILQVRINQNPFSAEFERPGAGRVEIITKPGNNEWHGGFGANFRNSALDARNAFAMVKPELDQKRYSFNLSGPLIRKRMSFFANLEQRRLIGSGTVRAEILNGPFVANVAAPNESAYFSARGDYLLNQKNTFNLVYSRSASEALNREFAARLASGGTSNFTLPERASSSEDVNHALQLAETWLINARLIHESRLRLQYDVRHLRANTQGYAVNVLDAFYGGGATCCPNNSRQFTAEWQDYLTYTHKKQTLRGGVQAEYVRQSDYSASNFNGTYTFSSLDQYRRALADPQVRATQFTQSLGNPRLRYDIYQAAWFVQDDVRWRQGLTLSFGLRHEFQSHLVDKLNFAPRFGLAWSPFKDRKTTLRLGAGIFYARLTGGVYNTTLRYNGVTQQSLIIPTPLFPDPFAGNPNIRQNSAIRWLLAPELHAPYVINLNGTVERQLTRTLVTTFGYHFTRGVHQFRARNINAPLPDGARPDPTQGNLFQIESSAASQYHGLQFRLDRRLGRNFTAFSSYSLAWTRSDADGPTAFPANSYDLRAEWGRALIDRRHNLYVGGSLRLPYGWRLAPSVNAYSGVPFNLTTGRDENGDSRINDRLAGVGRNADLPASLYATLPERCLLDCRTGGQQISLRDFLSTKFPNGVRAEGPGYFSANLSVTKIIGFGQRKANVAAAKPGGANVKSAGKLNGVGAKGAGLNGQNKTGKAGGQVKAANNNSEAPRFSLQLGAQISNLFNRVNFGQYSGVLTSPFFGRANSASTARQFEFTLRFSF